MPGPDVPAGKTKHGLSPSFTSVLRGGEKKGLELLIMSN